MEKLLEESDEIAVLNLTKELIKEPKRRCFRCGRLLEKGEGIPFKGKLFCPLCIIFQRVLEGRNR